MTEPITERVINWNKARYDQVFDYDLAMRLLLEETQELYSAETVVDKLDAIGDIVFVAIGVLWKLGFSRQMIYDIFYVHDMTKMTMAEAHLWSMNVQSISMDIIDHDVPAAWPGLVLALYSVFNTCIGASIGLNTQNIFYDVVHAICDSNDTKDVKRVEPGVKANVVKGHEYVPPTEALFILYVQSMKNKGLMQ